MSRGILISATALLLAAGAAAQPSLDTLARIQSGQARRASSADPDAAGNRDARPIEPLKTLVPADLEGPGEITHIWTTIASRVHRAAAAGGSDGLPDDPGEA